MVYLRARWMLGGQAFCAPIKGGGSVVEASVARSPGVIPVIGTQFRETRNPVHYAAGWAATTPAAASPPASRSESRIAHVVAGASAQAYEMTGERAALAPPKKTAPYVDRKKFYPRSLWLPHNPPHLPRGNTGHEPNERGGDGAGSVALRWCGWVMSPQIRASTKACGRKCPSLW